MMKTPNTQSTVATLRTIGVATVAFLLGGLLSVNDHQSAQAQYERTPAPKAFLSGGARSEKVLLEISATAKRIEAHLENIDKSLRTTKQP